MRIHIGKIKGKRGAYQDFSFREPLSAPWESQEAHLEGPVEFAGRVTNTGKGYLVDGALRAVAKMRCDRCLEPFTVEISSEVEEEFRPAPGGPRDFAQGQEPADEREKELQEWNVFQGEAISLDDVVRDHLVIGLPPKVLCHAECKGICPQCGQNLNQADCDCSLDDVDPRLAVLMDLLKKDH